MKKRFVLIAALLIILFSAQVKAFEVFYSGQKDISFTVDWTVDRDPETGQLVFYPSTKFGQSLQLYLHGEDEDGYLRGFITDHPALLDQIYMDLNLGDFKLQWDKFNEGFLRPSWFNLEHKFYGLRFNYSTELNEAAFLGVTGQNHWREEDVIVEPSDSVQVIPLQNTPVVFGSVQVWMNGEQLSYSSDFYVDTELNVVKLLLPVHRTAHLRITYLQESSEYLVFGGRLDQHFILPVPEQQLDAGVLYLHTRNEDGKYDLFGTEWLYQPKPWWWIELNAGMVKELLNIADADGLEEVLPVTEYDPNWRISNQFQWPSLEVKVDYQVVSNRFQDLLNLGSEGRHLHVNGLYSGETLLMRHRQDYHWMLDGTPLERSGDIEMMWMYPNWIPYVYYSLYDWDGLIKQQAIAELGYQVELSEQRGLLTYLLGADVKTASDDPEVQENTRPYLGVRYQKKGTQSLGMRIYGERGMQFDQMILFGDWEQGTTRWKGQFSYQPGYLQLNQNLTWSRDVNVHFNWAQTQYFAVDEGYLDLSLSLDFSQITSGEDQVWLNLIQENKGDIVSRTYSLGGEKSYELNKVLYGEVGISDRKKSFTAGLRGSGKAFDYDLSYSRAEEWVTSYLGLNEAPTIELVKTDKIIFSAGAEDHLSLIGDLEVASDDRFAANLDLSFPLMKDVTFGIHYSGDKDLTTYHMVELRTVYHF